MKESIKQELIRRAKAEGNGFIITMKRTGRKYSVYFQENGKYLITDKYNIWMKETYKKTFSTLDGLAAEICGLAGIAA